MRLIILLLLTFFSASLAVQYMLPGQEFSHLPMTRIIRGSANPSDDELLAETAAIDRQLESVRSRHKKESGHMEMKQKQKKKLSIRKATFGDEDYGDLSSTPSFEDPDPDTVTFGPSDDDNMIKEMPKDGQTEVPVALKGGAGAGAGAGTGPKGPGAYGLEQPRPAVGLDGVGANPMPMDDIDERPIRTGYYFQHYPWYLLPRNYRMRPTYPYVYPPKYQNAVWAWPGRLPPNYDPFAVYESTKRARDSYYGGGCGGGAGGCGGGGGGYGGGGYGGNSEGFGDEDFEEGSDEARSGEVELSKKKDPLDDLDIETLEKIDKLSSSEIDSTSDRDKDGEMFNIRAKALRARAILA